MDYLISEGYPSAAQKFAHEANIAPAVEMDSVEERVAIREALHKGDIQTAIEKINEINPQVRSHNVALLQGSITFKYCNDYILFMHHS